MQFIPIVERIAHQTSADGLHFVSSDFGGAARVAPWSVEPRQFGRFLCSIFDESVCNDVGRYYVQLFDVAPEMWVGMEASLCVFRKQCGSALAIEHCGDRYSCDHFVYPQNRMGNMMKAPLEMLVNSDQQRRFGEAKESALPKYCRKCEARFACNGEWLCAQCNTNLPKTYSTGGAENLVFLKH